MTPEQVFVAGWQAALAFQKANSDSKHSLERNVNMSVTPLGRFASGAG